VAFQLDLPKFEATNTQVLGVSVDFNNANVIFAERLGLRFPEDIGFVVHDWTPKMEGFAGIHQQREHLAAAAVDLVVTQLSQHEHGVPEVARQIMILPKWVEGPSVRAS
jgi:LacI family transcriptional regulator